MTITKELKISRLKVDPLWEDESYLVIDANSIPDEIYLATSKLDFAAEGSEVILIDDVGFELSSTTNEKNKKSLQNEKQEEIPQTVTQ